MNNTIPNSESNTPIDERTFREYLDLERREALTKVDRIDRILGKSKRRTVRCQNCGHDIPKYEDRG